MIRSFGPYDIVARMGSGGMADLYLGTMEGAAEFHRPVVIKVIKKRLAQDDALVQMFLDEARLAAAIHHPNVIRIVDLGELEGSFYLVMEYVHGASLSDLLKKLASLGRRLRPGAAVALVADIAAGLHAAHEARNEEGEKLEVIHRDVSPHNVLVGADGLVRVIDFGIAKARDRLHETQGLRVKGKLRYMPPEQLSGGQLDRRADVFALGILLSEALSGRRMFGTMEDADVIRRIQSGKLPSLGKDVAVPDELRATLVSTLSADPEGRPATAHRFRSAILDAVPAAFEFDEVQRAALLLAVLGAELDDRSQRLAVAGANTLDTGELSSLPAQAIERWTEDLPPHVPSLEPPPPPSAKPVSVAPPRRSILGMSVLAGMLAVGVGVGAFVFLTARSDRAENATTTAAVAERADVGVTLDAGADAQPVREDPAHLVGAVDAESDSTEPETTMEVETPTMRDSMRGMHRTMTDRGTDPPESTMSTSMEPSNMQTPSGFPTFTELP